ncbi:MAG: riboflavin synthase subunit alpha [Endozoicomonas sp.]
MFTGIVKGVFNVDHIDRREEFLSLTLRLTESLCEGLENGASVAINGVCLTVTSVDAPRVTFDVMKETLRVTNLGKLSEGSRVNIERAARFGDEIGGHLLSGHIYDIVVVEKVIHEENNTEVCFRCDSSWADYIMPKGYLALNGASLTVSEDVSNGRFSVHLIPETLRLTTFVDVKEGDRVNLEIDSQIQAVVDTVKQYMERDG